MRKPDPLKFDIVRYEILGGAKDLFQTYGLEKTTMEDIAEAAGKGKSTLYYYFKKKEDVFYAVVKEEMLSIMETVEKGIKLAHTAEEKLRLFFTIHDNAIRNKAKLYPIIFKETKKHVPLLHRIRRETHTNEIKTMKAILLEGLASGEFKSISKEECENIAITGITIMHGMHLTLFLDGKVPSVEDKMAVLLDIFLRGLK